MHLAIFQSAEGSFSVDAQFARLAFAVKAAKCDLMVYPELYISGCRNEPLVVLFGRDFTT